MILWHHTVGPSVHVFSLLPRVCDTAGKHLQRCMLASSCAAVCSWRTICAKGLLQPKRRSRNNRDVQQRRSRLRHFALRLPQAEPAAFEWISGSAPALARAMSRICWLSGSRQSSALTAEHPDASRAYVPKRIMTIATTEQPGPSARSHYFWAPNLRAPSSFLAFFFWSALHSGRTLAAMGEASRDLAQGIIEAWTSACSPQPPRTNSSIDQPII